LIHLQSDVVVVEVEELLHELEVGVAEVSLVMQELQVLLLHHAVRRLWQEARLLERL